MRVSSQHNWMAFENLGRTVTRCLPYINNASRRRKCNAFSRLYFESLEDRRLLAVGNPLAHVDTNVGNFVMELLPDEAPNTVQNFLNYVNDGDYINTIFHRSINSPTPFVIQTGGFTSADEVFTSVAQFVPVPEDPPILNEFNVSNTFGTVGVARTNDPNSGTSQWYINLADNSFLDTQVGGFTVFARVIDMQVPNEIAALPTTDQGGPFTDLPLTGGDRVVRIESITIEVNDPGFSYVDANNNGQFDPGTDVALVGGELDDGVFDTRVAEGGYSTAIPGAGLYVGGAPISVAGDIKYKADGDVKINTDLDAGDDIDLLSSAGSVLLDDPTISAFDDIKITAAGDIISTNDVIVATGPGSEVELKAGWNITLFDTTVTAVREVELKAGVSIDVGASIPATQVLTASDPARGEVELKAGLDINLSEVQVVAGKEIELKAGSEIFARAILQALGSSQGEIELKAGGDINVDFSTFWASKEVELKSTGGGISSRFATLDATGSSKGEVELKAAGNINVNGATLKAGKEIELRSSGGGISAIDAVMEALGSSKGEIELRAALDIDLTDADLDAGKEIDIIGCTVDVMGATLTAPRVRIRETC